MTKTMIPTFYWVAVSKVNGTYGRYSVSSDDKRDPICPSNVAMVLAGRRAYGNSNPVGISNRKVSHALSVLYAVDEEDIDNIMNSGPALFVNDEPVRPVGIDTVNFRDITEY